MTNAKRAVLVVSSCAFLLISFTTVFAYYSPQKSQKKDIGIEISSPQDKYAPSEVIVKIKEGADPQTALKKVNPEKTERIHSIKPAVAKFKKSYKFQSNKQGKIAFQGAAYDTINTIPDETIFAEASKQMDSKEKSMYRTYKIKLPKNVSIGSAISQLQSLPDVEYVQPNYKKELYMVPNDPYYFSIGTWGQLYDDLWGLKPGKLNCEAAWDITQGEGVVVAVVDTGVDYTHEDLAANIWVNTDEIPGNGIDDDGNGYIDDVRGWDFSGETYPDVLPDNDPLDVIGHGSHCAGTIAAVGNNGKGLIGVAPKATIMPVKIFPNAFSDVCAQGIKYAADNGARVLSNSWGGPGGSDPVLEEAIDYAYGPRGAVLVFAAGNDNADVSGFTPANYPKVIAVAASTQNDEKCSFSNYGDGIDVAAPGGGYENELGSGPYDESNILSAMPDSSEIALERSWARIDGGYYRLAGTSMACPHVAGVAALAIAANPALKNDQISQLLSLYADDIGAFGRDPEFGAGRVNAYNAAVNAQTFVGFTILSPDPGTYLKNTVEIKGSVSIGSDLRKYELLISSKSKPTEYTILTDSSDPVVNDTLGTLNTMEFPDGEYILTLKVYCNSPFISETSINVAIDNYNDPPEIDVMNNKLAPIGKTLSFLVPASDPDDPQTAWGDLRYSVSNLPPGAAFDPQNHTFSWTPATSDKGASYKIKFIVSDSEFTATKEVKISTVYLEEQLLLESSNSLYPMDLYQDKILFTEYCADGKIVFWLYDIASGSKTKLDEGVDNARESALYGDKAVLSERIGSMYYLKLFDLVTGGNTIIEQGETSIAEAAMYKNRIVYEYGNEEDLVLYDIVLNQKKTLVSQPGSQVRPSLYEDILVWADDRDGDFDIYTYDFSTLKESQIPIEAPYQFLPDIYQKKIVWCDTRNGNEDVFLYDLATGKEQQITSSSRDQGPAGIFGDLIVYIDAIMLFMDQNILAYDMYSNAEFAIANSLDEEDGFKVYQNNVVWVKNQGDKKYLMLTKIYFIPAITAVDKTTAAIGQTFIITGKKFGYSRGTSTVQFANGAVAAVTSWSDEKITCIVPANAATGYVYVSTPGGTSNGVYLKVTGTAPAAGTVSPAFGTAQVNRLASFTATYSDPNTYKNIRYACFMIKADGLAPDGKNCCCLLYDQSENKIYLLGDDGNWNNRLGGFAPGSLNTMENSYVKVFCSGTKVSGSGNTLTVQWEVSFKDVFAEENDTYLYVKDYQGLSNNQWEKKGTWHISNPPVIVSVTPSTGSSTAGQGVLFSATYSDKDGVDELLQSWLAVSTLTNIQGGGKQSFVGLYNQDRNVLGLLNDAATGWTSGAPGENKILENSYVKIDCSKSTVAKTGTTVTVTWHVTFKNTFAGNKDIFAYVKDAHGITHSASATWSKYGSWMVQ